MLWIKTIHILFVIAWMAGIFYLPRIFVHYVEGKEAGEDVSRLVTMAEKLFKFSTLMSLLAVIPGVILWLGFGISGNWLGVKLMFVLLLFGYQIQSLRYVRQMRGDLVIQTSIFFRIYNESALLIVIPILIMVVVKPF